MNELQQKVWEEKYKYREEKTREETFKRVADIVLPEMYQEMCDNKFMPGGRILAGAGIEEEVTLANCFVLSIKDDTVEAIFECARDAATTYKSGGGVGINISTLRPKGAPVNNAARASTGAVSFMELFDTTTKVIGGQGRRGALMLSLSVNHPDVLDFIKCKDDDSKTAITNANISVMLTDEFMVAVEEDDKVDLWFPKITDSHIIDYVEVPNIANCYDVESQYYKVQGEFYEKEVYKRVRAREIWDAIILRAWSSAEPGVLFWSSMIEDNNTQSDLPLVCTNPCISKDNYILTSAGYKKIEELIGVPFTAIYNNEEYECKTGFFATGKKQVSKISLSDGNFIKGTKTHKFFTSETEKEAVENLVGKEILISTKEITSVDKDSIEFKEGYLIGHVLGDGYFKNGNPVFQVWKDEGEVAQISKFYQDLTGKEAVWVPRDYKGVQSQTFNRVGVRPIFEKYGISKENKRDIDEVLRNPAAFLGVLSGLVDADGSVQGNKEKGFSLRINQSDETLLQKMLIGLRNFGVYSTLRLRRAAGNRNLPDSNRELKSYQCKANYELIISSINIKKVNELLNLANTAKTEKLQHIIKTVNFYNKKVVVKVKELVEIGLEEVYDCTVEKVHRYVCNGVVISNCAEQPLPDKGACTLGSINLAAFVTDKFIKPKFDYEDFSRVVALGVRFLDNTLDITANPLSAQSDIMRDYRRIGLGVTGLAHCLAYMKMQYDSDTAVHFIEEVASILESVSYQTSVILAREKGAYPAFNPEAIEGHLAEVINRDVLSLEELEVYGIRNSCLNTIAPSGSISLLMDTSYGIEPIYELAFTRNSDSLSQSSFEVYDKAYNEYKEVTGKTNIPEFFTTAYDIVPEKKVEMQGVIQKYIDSSISVTTNLPKDATTEDVSNIYKLAWETGCKGHTVYRQGSRSAVLETNSASLLRDNHNILSGKTIVIPSRDGKVYLTVNTHPITGKAVEVFLSSAKSGSDLKAVYEGYGRVISLHLQNGGGIEDVISTLININGKDTYFAQGWTINSLPDLIAKGLLKVSEGVTVMTPCPECGKEVTMSSGCMVCSNCGYSKCG